MPLGLFRHRRPCALVALRADQSMALVLDDMRRYHRDLHDLMTVDVAAAWLLVLPECVPTVRTLLRINWVRFVDSLGRRLGPMMARVAWLPAWLFPASLRARMPASNAGFTSQPVG